MFYSYELTATAGGSSSSYQELDLDLSAGVIHQVDFMFPDDADKDLHVKVVRGGHQLWPTNVLGSLKGDNMIVSFREFMELTSARNNLTLRAWNTHATDDLNIIINIGILPREIMQPFSIADMMKLI